MRIGIAGFYHETNTFSPIKTAYEDFEKVRGDEMLDHPVWQELRQRGHELYPLLQARARPSGSVTRECLGRIRDEIVSGFSDCPSLDALFLVLHGAMEVEGIGNGEESLLTAIQRLTGDEVFVCGTLDLHGNLSADFVHSCDFLTALRTAPHRDERQTLERGVRLMMRCLEEGIRPTTEFIQLPLLLAGEHAVTEVEPARTLYAHLPRVDSTPGILTSSIMVGCPWTDSPDTGMSVLVSGGDPSMARRESRSLANDIWSRREEFRTKVPVMSPDEAIRYALNTSERPVFISDSGDNVTAGGAGDNAFLLERLLEVGAKQVLVAGIVDPRAVQTCFRAGENAEVDLDEELSTARSIHGRVRRLYAEAGRALLALDDVYLILQSDRRAVRSHEEIHALGIEPDDLKIIVVKLGLLLPDLRDYAPGHVIALTPGCTDLRLSELPYRRLRRPIYPLDPTVEWTAG